MSNNEIIVLDTGNPDTNRRILQEANDELHDALKNNQVAIVVVQDKQDKTKFKIVTDSLFTDKRLVSNTLTFADPKAVLKIFPELHPSQNPIHVPPLMTKNQETGQLEVEHKDPYQITAIVATPQVVNENFMVGNVLSDDKNTKWAVKANPATITLDLGKVVDVGAVWVAWSHGDQRQFNFDLLVSKTESEEFQPVLMNVLSSGTTSDYEPYNLAIKSFYTNTITPTRKVRFIHIVVKGNTFDEWASIAGIKVTKATGIESAEVVPKEPKDEF